MQPADVQALSQRASALRQAGRVPEAIAAYEALLARAPALPNSWYNLGLLLRRAHRPDDALAAYRRALALGIADPEEVHLNCGVIYADDLKRPAEAHAELQRALALNPRYVPALLNLGNLHEDLGERAPAAAAYERVLALAPAHADALARLAGLTPAAQAGDALVERLQRALAAPRTAAEAASLGFALARLLDGRGAHDAAFDAAERANAASRAATPEARYDARRHAAFVDRLIETFAVAANADAAPPIDPQPLFVCGMLRSGSTLAEQVLAGHPDVRAGGELGLLPTLVQERLAPYPESLRTAGAAQRLAELAATYREHVARLFPGAQVVTDKRPENYLHVGLIKGMFPRAKIVHTVRDPLDTGLSIFFLHAAPSQAYATDLAHIGHHQRQYQRLMTHWRRLYPGDIFDLDYDRFVREPRAVLAELLAFCGLPWDEACLDFNERDNAVRTASVWQVRQPLYTASSGRWRPYAQRLAPLTAALDQTS